MAGLKASVAEVLNKEYKADPKATDLAKSISYQKKKALAASIEATLVDSLGTNTKLNLKASAESLADQIVNADDALTNDMNKFIDSKAEDILDTTTNQGKLKEAEVAAEQTSKANELASATKIIAALKLPENTDDKAKKALVDALTPKMKDLLQKVDTKVITDDASKKAAIDALKTQIIASVKAADPKLPEISDKDAQDIATQAIDSKIATEAKKAADIKAVADGKDATRKAILKGAREKAWPEMLRQDVPPAQKLEFVRAVMADSVRGDGTLSPDQIKRVNFAASKLAIYADVYKPEEGQDIPTKHATALESLRSAAGVEGDFFKNFKVSTGTAVGGGAGAALGLLVADTKSTWGIAKGALAALAGAGIGAAYDNGLFDNMVAGKTPTGGGPGGKNGPAVG
jgi:phenylpyruvate tautomerase PptA (4-oxalocrotonate tautomerase family)